MGRTSFEGLALDSVGAIMSVCAKNEIKKTI